MRVLAPALALAASASCVEYPSHVAYQALDYHIDRPRVLGIRFDPPIAAHGQPVRVDALALGPEETEVTSVEICGLEDDALASVWGTACFSNPELVTELSHTAPFTWEPPDLSAAPCSAPDTGFAWWDTGDRYGTDGCASYVPLLVTATMGRDTGRGLLSVPIRRDPYDGEPLPTPIHHVERALEVVGGDVVAGGEVALAFRVDADVYDGVRWYVDAGELVRTGRTAVHRTEGETRISENALRIPRGYSGALRVAVVVSAAQAGDPYVGDLTWSVLTLEVP